MRKTTRLLGLALLLLTGTTVSAQETQETELTSSLFHVWDGVGANAQPSEEGKYFTMQLETALEGGAVVYGNGNVSATQYADLTGHTKLVALGQAGGRLRVLLNRQSDDTAPTEKVVTLGEDGRAELDLGDIDTRPYVHLNCIKVPWGGTANISRLYLVKEVVKAPALPALASSLFHVWDGVGAEARQTTDAPYCQLNLGTALGGGGVVYGNVNVSNRQYADLTGYTRLIVIGEKGGTLRLMFNRQEDNTLNEQRVTLDGDGRAELSLTGLDALGYVHLNCIKVAWGSTANVTALYLAEAMPLGISDVGYATFSGTCNTIVPEGLTVYTARATHTAIVLAPLAGKVIPARTGVVVKGTPGTSYAMETTDAAADPVADNDLLAATAEVAYDAAFHVLAAEDGRAVFAPLAAGTSIPAGKAYLGGLPAGAKHLPIVSAEATAIGKPHATAQPDSEALYNLAGQRVDKGYKGIVVKNGHKFVNR